MLTVLNVIPSSSSVSPGNSLSHHNYCQYSIFTTDNIPSPVDNYCAPFAGTSI